MAEGGRFDPMLLESSLHNSETLGDTPLVARDGAIGISSSHDLSQSPEQGEGTGTQVGEEHWPGTPTQPIRNGRTYPEQEQEGQGPFLNPPSDGSKKRKNWSEDAETDLLMRAVASEKVKTRSRLNNEPFWDGVARGVPGRTGKECRRRVETLKKSYIAVKEYCDKEVKEFSELDAVDFGKMKLAARMRESWYNQIRDHCPPRPAKRSRARGPGNCPTSGEVGLIVGGSDNSGVFSTDVATTSGPPGVGESSAASGMVVCQAHDVPPKMPLDRKANHHPTGASEDGPSSAAPLAPHPAFAAHTGFEDLFELPECSNSALINHSSLEDVCAFDWASVLLDEDLA